MAELIILVVIFVIIFICFYKMYKEVVNMLEDFEEEANKVRNKWLKLIERMEEDI